MYGLINEHEYKNHSLNRKICWQKLPWRKIHLRLYMLIKQIFREAKKHNLYYVYKLQTYLLNSSELRIFSMNRVFSNFHILYHKNLSKISLLNDKFSLDTLKQVFSTKMSKSKETHTLINKIKQEIIYTCIRPVYQARSVQSLIKYRNVDSLNFLNNECEFYYYLKNDFIRQKLSLNNYINKLVFDSLDNVNHLDINKLLRLRYKTQTSLISYCGYLYNLTQLGFLIQIINQATATDLDWYSFYKFKHETRKNNKLFLNLKNNYEKTQIVFSSILKLLKVDIKSIIDVKNFRISSYLYANNKTNYLVQRIMSIYSQWYRNCGSFIHTDKTKKCNLFVNQVIHLIIQKNIPFVKKYLQKRISISILINNFTYLYNISDYYLRYIRLTN